MRAESKTGAVSVKRGFGARIDVPLLSWDARYWCAVNAVCLHDWKNDLTCTAD